MVLRPLRKLPPCANAAARRRLARGARGRARRPDGATARCSAGGRWRSSRIPEYAANWETAVADASLPAATRLALAALDPRNITLEPEYYAECDDARFQRGEAAALALVLVRPHCRSAARTWSSASSSGGCWRSTSSSACGENFKAFQHVEFSFGYNMEVGDNVVVHRHVLLDDRGGIVLGNNVSISDYANIYSHTHSIVDQRDVTNAMTVLEDGVRITYHATVLAGVHVNEQGMVGAMAVATKDVRRYHVYVGIPAKSVRVKPNAPTSRHA